MDNSIWSDMQWYSNLGFIFIMQDNRVFAYTHDWTHLYTGDNIKHAFMACDLALEETL